MIGYRASKQKEAVKFIGQNGYNVVYDFHYLEPTGMRVQPNGDSRIPRTQNWFERTLGDDYFHQVRALNQRFGMGPPNDPMPFDDLPGLKTLTLFHLPPLANSEFRNLEHLFLINLYLKPGEEIDWSLVTKSKNLRLLDLHELTLNDLSPLADLPKLERLRIASSNLKSLKGLEELKQLKRLELDVALENLEGMPGTSGVEELILTSIKSLKGIENFPNLKRLNLQTKEVEHIDLLKSISPLEETRDYPDDGIWYDITTS